MTKKNSVDPDKYLARIGASRPEEPNTAALGELMQRHLTTVPFENLDIVAGSDVVLLLNRIFEKVVERKRGGYCYELNSLFRWLLSQLGYETSLVAGRVYNPNLKTFGPEFDHMAILVYLDRTYLADVGFGQSFRNPLALPESEIEDPLGKFQLRPESSEPDRYVVKRSADGKWQPLYDFTTHARKLTDFQEMNACQQTSPHSLFTKGVLCSIATPNGWLTLHRETFIITEGERTERVAAPSDKMRERIIAEHFGITRL
jgi:N-hydroxyarylamine O-acetyltransferase